VSSSAKDPLAGLGCAPLLGLFEPGKHRMLARVSWIARRELLSPQLRVGVWVELV
jgi:hypothetical protein